MSFVNGLLVFVAFVGGAALAIQSGFNSQLGKALNQPLAAISISLAGGAVISGLLWISKSFRNSVSLEQAAPHLWFSGAIFSVLGIGIYFVIIPRIGINTTIAAGLVGQIVFSAIASHQGWFNLPAQPINLTKAVGMALMVVGVLLITSKS
ncbi:DMT family transporter [Phaeocystidibacter marisrubri]|uniref:DMT family transporter n=1 Tax=Phaeocystidibacter marisrubri TaxID=1577780 RepID=A0A6L3ZD01_9FLAO|nr:DMT family transporter [Phaeocystidibacter marisrubri]KAB2815540.1 DMT family transporter [Phaeocystidibacter marisrubri]GGH64425.1 hypothetical protein GCM10011318_00440 [Phaeocystidibacter marisrubri]